MRRNSRMSLPAIAAAVTLPAEATLSIESMSIEQILDGRAVLSIEEEVVALQEADDLAATVTADVAEVVRVEDVTDTMLNIADTVGEIKDENGNAGTVTPEQAMLIDCASEMAVAGSDGDPDDVITSAEVLLDEKSEVTTESFIEDIKKRSLEIWNRIRQFCVQIWNSIKEFFKRIFMAAPRLLHRVKQLRDAVAAKKKDAKDAKPKSNVISILVGANAISYPDYQVRDTKELQKGLGEIKTIAQYAFGSYLKDCKYMGEKVAGELKKFDPKKAAEHLSAVAKGLPVNNFTNVPGGPATGYMGCFDVKPVRIDKSRLKDLSDAQIVGALRNTCVKLVTRQGRAPLLNTKNGFQTMNFAEMDSTLNDVEGLVKMVIAYETSADSKTVEKVRVDLEAGGNHAAQAVGAMQGSDEAGKAERAYALDVMKGLANFNTSLTRWVSDLPMPVAKKIYQSARSSLMVVENSLRQYA